MLTQEAFTATRSKNAAILLSGLGKNVYNAAYGDLVIEEVRATNLVSTGVDVCASVLSVLQDVTNAPPHLINMYRIFVALSLESVQSGLQSAHVAQQEEKGPEVIVDVGPDITRTIANHEALVFRIQSIDKHLGCV